MSILNLNYINLKEIQLTYRGKTTFKGSDGVEYKVTDLFKSSDFGGGSGSGGGADDTERNESAQCLYAALAFYVYRKEIPINKKSALSAPFSIYS